MKYILTMYTVAMSHFMRLEFYYHAWNYYMQVTDKRISRLGK